MGEMSKEPSMEEILSSIKRIIAEDAQNAVSARGRAEPKARGRRDLERESHRKAVIANMVADGSEDALSYVDEVLELTDEMPRVGKGADMGQETALPETGPDTGIDDGEAAASRPAASSGGETAKDKIVSVESEVAARTSLAALSSMVVQSSEQGESHTLEGLVRDMLRPMLKEWLDANLPTMVEGMVAREIARITGRPL
ncbi:MAG: DUF2497 domain-containing protein [Sphingobium sp.]